MVVAGNGETIPPSTEAELEYAVSREEPCRLGPNGQPCGFACSGTAVVNAWDFFDLPDSTPEFRLDGPEESDGTRSNFELVRAGAVSGW